MEAEKPHNLPSASWRSRKTGSVIPVQIHRPRNQGSQWCKFQFKSKACRVRAPCPRAGEDGYRQARESTLLVLFRPSVNRTVPTDIGDRQSLLNPSIQMPVSSEIPPTDIPRNAYQLFRDSLAVKVAT